ncbi:MAG: SusE domain-containing protein [Ginsengibacter sp.]
MRYINNFIFLSLIGVIALNSCKKIENLPQYENGTAVTLTASKTSVAPALADSLTNVVTFSWSSPQYAVDSSTYKFILEIDTSGRSFSKKVTKEIKGNLNTGLTGRELNNILLNYGFAPGSPYSIDVRVVSSYSNNNERYVSNVVKVTVTPFTDPSKLTTQNTTVTGTAATSTSASNTFSWSPAFPGYGGIVNYVIQYDSAGKNFTSPFQIAGYGGNSIYTASLNQGDMNTTALTSGIAVGVVGKVEYRMKATTASGAVAYSNVVNVTTTPFSPVPANLYIVGDATPGGWANPVPTPSQQFSKVDAYKFSITLLLDAGKTYLFLPVNGDWGHKYGGLGANNTNNVNGDDFKPEGSDMKAPAVTGVYEIVVDFQTNKFTVTQIVVPTNLYLVGDATPGGWANPVATPSQQFTKLNNVSFGIVVNLTADKSYVFLPLNGDWGHKFGGTGGNNTNNVNGDRFKAEGSDMKAPATSGLYLIIVNFATSSFSVTPYTGPTNLYLVGDATPGGWANPVPVPSQQFIQSTTGIFQLTLPLTADKSYVLLPVNGDWSHKFGGIGANNTNNVTGDSFKAEGSDLKAPATSGSHTITVNFITMKFTVQ